MPGLAHKGLDEHLPLLDEGLSGRNHTGSVLRCRSSSISRFRCEQCLSGGYRPTGVARRCGERPTAVMMMIDGDWSRCADNCCGFLCHFLACTASATPAAAYSSIKVLADAVEPGTLVAEKEVGVPVS
jgi:hypothetical protein